jgi:cysteine desulfurase
MPDRIYIDNNATPKPDSRVVEEMLKVLGDDFGNPSSGHFFGQRAAALLETAREHAAKLIGADPLDIVFTSGGTEANNLALRGALAPGQPGRIVTSQVEHPSVRATMRDLAKQGFELVELPVDGKGNLDLDLVEKQINADTRLVSIMAANNETGVIFPIQEIGRICQRNGALFHVDAVQFAGKMPVDLATLPVDLLSYSGHKIHGPKGVAILFVRKGVPLAPRQTGGGQERGLRPGTENVPGIIGLGEAARLALAELGPRAEHCRALRDRLETAILAAVPTAVVNGDRERRLPNTANISFPGAEGEAVSMTLDLKGVAVSTGSACSSGHSEPSHVLTAMGLPYEIASTALRLSVGKDNTEAEIDRAASIIIEAVTRIRSISGRG